MQNSYKGTKSVEKIGVIGLGYVGLPLAMAFSKEIKTIGYDSDKEKIKVYMASEEFKNSNLEFTWDENRLKEANVIIVAVPTPINGENIPDLNLVKEASIVAGRNLTRNTVVVYESTVYPGVTEDICIPILERESKLIVGKDFKVGYSPERINPGDKTNVLGNIVKIVSGIDDETIEYISSLYELIIEAGTHTEYLSYQSFKDYNQVLNYVKNLKKGSIITIKMDGVLEEDEYSKPPEPAKPAIDKQSTVPKDNIVIELTPKERLINMVDWLLRALEETEHKSVLVEDLEFYDNGDLNKEVNKEQTKTNTTKKVKKTLWFKKQQSKEPIKESIKGITKEELDEFRKNNNGKKSKEYSTIYTTEKSLSYTFYGVSNIEVLNKVLDNLDILEVKGTFYITKKDLIDMPDTIKRIAEKGHEIGISLKESEDKDFYSTLETILFVQREVNKLTDQTPALVRYPYYLELNDEILEAISSGNCTVLWDNISISSSKVGKDGTLKDVMNNAFGESNISVHRGYVIYYRMDYYNDINIIPDSMLKIVKDRIDTIAYSDEIPDNGSSYSIRPAGDIMKGHKVYNYPLKDEEILHIVKDKIHSGYLLNYGESDKFDLIKNKYIGNPFIGTPNTLPGFTEEELKDVDKTGVFTDDKVLFLTFDDWATDKAINQLLYVLDKHDIKASFFIRTNYIDNNPNILRGIAEAGHDVGSHTNNHLPFAIAEDTQEEDDTKSIYYSPGEEELLERKKDLLVSYNKLQYIIGDIYMDNRPALNTILRPPTLAMSRSGMEAILDMGFSHIVSGDFSTRDYEDKKPEALVYKIVNGMVTDNGNPMNIQNGSILVLHMSDFKGNPFYDPNLTAKALDMAIPILKSKGYSFARLSDYLK
ncbi:polysaccharide deacetylase family protein [Tissierella pigra]|uniref:polysaccharide deacetylase family protein n=1 Tax=Tissierella pigra TaxID=2607614 RepID=UPI001C124E0A|nr:polysaccharide deacetylase family protein [Tissierella pigra]MBU5428076.1 polysaccharide deacetylase family protein [Tissierella pigra]